MNPPESRTPRAPLNAVDLNRLHATATFLRVLGVDYVHIKTAEGGDLYLTRYGVPFSEHLQPQNWIEKEWLEANRVRLDGTGTVYKLPTRPIKGHLRPAIDLLIKWSRVGQDVALDTFTLDRNINAEFNSPFEEFSLVTELRRGAYGPKELRILTQKPLAIYAPPEQLQLWQTGRSKEKILTKIKRYPSVTIEILRSYILVYGWLRGLDAVQWYRNSYLSRDSQDRELASLTRRADTELGQKGFLVADHKPAHIIVRTADGKVKTRKGRAVYGLVDYELLARTDEYEDEVTTTRRQDYLQRQRDRFIGGHDFSPFPQYRVCTVVGLDYIYAHTESTNGMLWVLGKDPVLFKYFRPERWRMRQIQLSDSGRTFYTRSKDGVHLVWKVSRTGQTPVYRGLLDETEPLSSYLTPFEKFAMALEMQRAGIRTVYPRAIYLTGGPEEMDLSIPGQRQSPIFDELHTPEGDRVKVTGHDFITLWGYWRGLEDADAPMDKMLWTPIDAQQAQAKGIISESELSQIMQRHRDALSAKGFHDQNLGPDHVLLCYIPGGALKLDAQGFPETRQCNFELIYRD